MDDESMWAADRVVAPTPGSAITIPETANEFAIKALFDRLLREIRYFSQHDNETLTDAWLRMKEMLRNCHGHNLTKGCGLEIWIGCKYWAGPIYGSCTKTSEEMNSCTIKDKKLVLPWGRTPRLDSGVRHAVDITRLMLRHLSYSCILRDYLFFLDAPLSLLGYGLEIWIGCMYWAGLSCGSCTKTSKEMNSCTIKDKPLVLPCGRTPRLDFGVRYKIGYGLEIWIGCKYWAGPICGSCTKPSEEMNYCTIKDKPLVLSWGRTPRLDFSVRGDTMHERPAGKIGLYTRFFDFAKFRLPLSTFLVDILRHGYISFIHTSDPTKVKVVEREQKEDEPRYWRLLSVVLFPCFQLRLTVRLAGKTLVADAGGPSHPPKKLREDHGTPSGDSVGGKSMSAVHRLFAGAVQNAKVRGEPIPTMPFVTSSVFVTSEREGEGHADSITGRNLRTISAPQRFVISSNSSHHSGANIVEAEVDSFARPSALVITAATTIISTADPAVVVKEKIIEPSLFAAESTSARGTDHAMAGSDFLVGGIRTVINPDSDLQKTYVPQWDVTNGSRLDDSGVCREQVEEFSPPKLFASVRGMEHDKLFIEFNVGATRQMSLSAEEAKAAEAILLRTEASKFETAEKSLWDEVNALNERNNILVKARNALDVKVTDLEAIVVSKERELTDSTAQLTSIKSQNDNLVDQDAQLKVVNDKFDKLYTDFVEMTLHMEDKFYLHLLTTISGRRWLFTHGMELAIGKFLNSPEYLFALGAAVSKAIEKGIQDGLASEITHGRQPHVDQLMVHIHHSLDKTVVGAFTLSLALDVSDARVWRISENIMSHRSLFQDVFIPLAKPLSAAALTGMEGTSNAVPATADITTALSVTLAFAGTVTLFYVDEYGVMGTDDQSVVNENVVDEDANPFPNVDDAKLNIPQ
nr:transposase (putative), gypsy type [Tanacetum cinerariifolium]